GVRSGRRIARNNRLFQGRISRDWAGLSPMNRAQSRWVNVIVIAVVVTLRSPTLLPSMYVSDEAYYGTIANDILDGGTVYHTAVDTKPPGMYYIYAAVFSRSQGGTTFLPFMSWPYLSSQPPLWSCGGLARKSLTNGRELGPASVMPCSSTLTVRMTHSVRAARFSQLFHSR